MGRSTFSKLPMLAAAVSMILLSACNREQQQLVLKPSTSTIADDGEQAVTFIVESGGADVTSESAIYMVSDDNYQKLQDNAFTSTEAGEYRFIATYKSMESEPVTIIVTEGQKELLLTSDTDRISDDGVSEAKFTVMYEGNDVTSEAEIYIIENDGEKTLDDNTFSSAQEGVYCFYATYSEIRSNNIYITVESPDSFELPQDPQAGSTDFQHRVLLLKNTGTACAFCPLLSASVKEVSKDPGYSDKIDVVEAHNYNDNDPMHNQIATRIEKHFNITYWPVIVYNFIPNLTSSNENVSNDSKINFEANIKKIKEIVDKQHSDIADAGICAVSQISDGVLNVKAAVKANKTAEYSIGVLLLEDNLKFQQNQYDRDIPVYPADFDPNKHSNVLRAIYDGCDIESTDFSGVNLGTIESGSSKDTEFTITLDNDWFLSNCKLLLYITSSDGERPIVRNTAINHIGAKTPYRYN